MPKNKKSDNSIRIVYVWAGKKEDTKLLSEKINRIKGVAAHLGNSWTKNRLDIHITNQAATKEFAIKNLLRILKVKKKEVMGVGDGDNDLPLFKSVGYKVAMGNGTDKLKKEADYITLAEDKDGLAKVIEKFS